MDKLFVHWVIKFTMFFAQLGGWLIYCPTYY